MKYILINVGPIHTNCYLLYEERTREAVIVDPGWETEKIIKKIESNRLNPSMILLTHGHFDHILAVPGLKEYFRIPVLCGENERMLLEDADFNMSRQMNRETVISPDRTFQDGEELLILGRKMRVLFTPGHTEGSVCYYFPEEELLLSGDTLFKGSYGRTDFPTGDYGKLVSSITKVLFTLPDNTLVLPGHMEDTTIGNERTSGEL